MQVSLLLHAVNIGFMIMFSAVVAPAVFRALSQKAAGAYLRVLFPRMFIYGFFTSALATITGFFEGDNQIVVISATIAIGFLINAFLITPKINNYRDKMLEGDLTAKKRFGWLHFLSVALFLSQLLASFYVIAKSESLLNQIIIISAISPLHHLTLPLG